MKIQFKQLKPDQIEVRPTDTKVQGQATLLLYIDSRSAADILNDAVGESNWQIEYKAVGDKVFGRLSIWDEERKMWIYKEDTGEESNIAAEKGLSSDILKRCLARWGCDYLYHTPRIRITCPDNYYYNERLNMSFSVSEIDFADDKHCTRLVIQDRFGNIVFDYQEGEKTTAPVPKATIDKPETPRYVQSDGVKYNSNIGILERFCRDLEMEDDTDMKQLNSFRNFYSKKLNDGWKGTFQPDTLWKRWMARAFCNS